MRTLFGIYAGTVQDNGDPLKMGRLRCRVPAIYGTVTGNEADGSSISDTDLPWALPIGLPAGGTNDSGMVGWLPDVGDHVYVQFLDGEPEKPLWTWGNQDTNQTGVIAGWTRSPGGYTNASTVPAAAGSDTPTVAPKSAFFTRYGHVIDFQPDTLTFRTANGYILRFTDSTQQLDIYSPNMVALVGALKFTGKDYQFNPANTFEVNTDDASISGNTVELNAVYNTLNADLVNKIVSPLVQLGPEGSAYGPVVRLGDLATALNLIMAQFNLHTHISSSPGSPTSPPIVPMILTATASTTTFTA